MLSSIHPFGERARRQRYGSTAVAFVFGASIGGLVLGTGLATIALVVRTFGSLPYLAMATLLTAAVWELIHLPVPSLERQVDENWLTRYRGWVYGLGFGVQLGVGFATYVKSSLTYGFAIAAVSFASPSVAFLAGSLFGLVRGLSVLLTRRVHSPQQLRDMFSRIGRSQNSIRVGGAVGVAAIALVGLEGLL